MDSLYILNGCITAYTSSSDVVRNKVAYTLQSSTENSATNSWNIRFSDGNVNNNNNNKNNSYSVRAVTALENWEKIGWLEAFRDCCRHKMSSKDCMTYRTHFWSDLWELMMEVYNRTYLPTTSSCFVVTRPKPREVFAANFRDRIVQHWIMLRIRPFFEDKFISQGNVSFNCRKGFGTLRAIDAIQQKISKVSEDYTKRTFIGKFDLRSFFMSVDKRVVLKILIPFVEQNYNEDDKDTLLYLINIVIGHCPQNNCVRRSPMNKWKLLSANKSLFCIDDNLGLAIGNITSQEVANFFMSYFDEWALSKCKPYNAEYIRFVDDFVLISNDQQFIIDFHKEACDWLSTHLELVLHKDKFYLQEAPKGIKFIGSVVKPGRRYTAKETVGRLIERATQAEYLCQKLLEHPDINNFYRLLKVVSSLNSYMGFMVHNDTYGLRRKVFGYLTFFWKCCYIKGKFSVVCVKNNFMYNKFLVKERTNYELELWHRAA